MAEAFRKAVDVLKVDEPLGLVLGWAIVSTEAGEPYFDRQGDHIPDESMLKHATEFMESSREVHVMHEGEQRGTVLFAWPMTAEIAKAYGIETDRTGLMVAYRPNAEDLERFRTGELRAFSIGGLRGEDEAA